MPVPLATGSSRSGYAERTAGPGASKYGLQLDGGERSRPHDVLPFEMHEIRYRLSL
jgi:hypothetical protein